MKKNNLYISILYMIIDFFKNKNFVILLLIIFLIGLLFVINYYQTNSNNVQMVESTVIVCKKSPIEEFGTVESQTIKPSSQPSQSSSQKMQFKVFYTNWCGWSKKALALLDSEEFKNKMKEVEDIAEVVRIDCENDGKEECKQKEINGYPTMILYKNENGTEKPIEFNGERTAEGIVSFIKNNN
jgi:thiol-disulfide isomerase/thioredoxin